MQSIAILPVFAESAFRPGRRDFKVQATITGAPLPLIIGGAIRIFALFIGRSGRHRQWAGGTIEPVLPREWGEQP
jgi:hypothetical protein